MTQAITLIARLSFNYPIVFNYKPLQNPASLKDASFCLEEPSLIKANIFVHEKKVLLG